MVKFWVNDPNVTAYADLSDYTCPFVFGDRIEEGQCQVKFPCGICQLPPAKRLLIKGICAKDAEYRYMYSKQGTLANIATLSTHLAAINSAFGAQPLTSL